MVKSLCGSRSAPKNWYQHLQTASMNELNFKESAIDPCLPCKKNILLVLYVDDAGISSPNKKIILELVEQLKSLGFDLEIEDDFDSHLGIGIEDSKMGAVT